MMRPGLGNLSKKAEPRKAGIQNSKAADSSSRQSLLAETKYSNAAHTEGNVAQKSAENSGFKNPLRLDGKK